MKANNNSILLEQPFDTVLSNAREAILHHDFLLLHEINPQAILATRQIITGKIRQLLFFHPVYMKQLLEHDPTAIIEAPLKLVLRATDTGATMLSYHHPARQLQGYTGLEILGKELQAKMEAIVEQLQRSA
ncbi:DUF302 domain-containing protein [Chitinophaga sp.]|uniref:DUF302 domain-containing protein n=1 Tax=Chitinophaga sp. TaxID=1869181 RepID=UPI002F93ADD1